MVTIRRTRADEGEGLRAIRLEALRSDPSAFSRTHDEEVIYDADHWDVRAAGSATSQTFVAVEADGSFVGVAAGYEPEPGRPVELVSMWTAPAARGRGIGRLLVEAVIEWATDVEATSVELWVTRGNEGALALYVSCGFTETDQMQPSPNDPCREEIRMHRMIAR